MTSLLLVHLVLSQAYLVLQQDGVRQGQVAIINCVGPSTTCTRTGTASMGVANVTSSGGGGGAPTNAKYITQQPDATLSAEQALSLLATGVMISTTATGVITTQAQLSQSNGGTGTTALTCAAYQRLTSNGTTYSCSPVVSAVETSITLSTQGLASVTVTGQAWVTASTNLSCTPFASAADDLTVETIAVAGLQLSWANRVVGTGFDVYVNNPNALVGTVRIHCVGV